MIVLEWWERRLVRAGIKWMNGLLNKNIDPTDEELDKIVQEVHNQYIKGEQK